MSLRWWLTSLRLISNHSRMPWWITVRNGRRSWQISSMRMPEPKWASEKTWLWMVCERYPDASFWYPCLFDGPSVSFCPLLKKLRNRLLEYFDTNTKTFHSEIKDMDALKARIALLEQCRKDDEEMENKIKPIEDKYAKLQEFEACLSALSLQLSNW